MPPETIPVQSAPELGKVDPRQGTYCLRKETAKQLIPNSSVDLPKHRLPHCKNKALSSFSCFKALASLRIRNETARAEQQPVPAFQWALDGRESLSPCAGAWHRQFWERDTLSCFA